MPDSGKFKDLYLNSAHTYPCQGRGVADAGVAPWVSYDSRASHCHPALGTQWCRFMTHKCATATRASAAALTGTRLRW